MTLGGLAAIIAAIAFAVLVGFIGWNLSKLATIMKEVQETVRRANLTIDVLTKDIDNLSIEVEGLLNKSNALVDDVNGKLRKTDPLFTAIGEIGESVSDLNDTTTEMATNLISGIGKKRPSRMSRLAKMGRRAVRSGNQFFDTDKDQRPSAENPTPKEEEKIEIEMVEESSPSKEEPASQLEREIFSQHGRPSSTAGKVNLH